MISTVIKSWGETHSESIIFENDQIQICDKILMSLIWSDWKNDIDCHQKLRWGPQREHHFWKWSNSNMRQNINEFDLIWCNTWYRQWPTVEASPVREHYFWKWQNSNVWQHIHEFDLIWFKTWYRKWSKVEVRPTARASFLKMIKFKSVTIY